MGAGGGYVVAPPSQHPNGTAYRWREGCSPDDVELADLPDGILEAIIGGQVKVQAHARRSSSSTLGITTMEQTWRSPRHQVISV